MEYNRSILTKTERYRRFFADDSPGQILASISPYTFHLERPKPETTAPDSGEALLSGTAAGKRGLEAWDFASPAQADRFIDRNVRNLRYFIDQTKDLDQDYIPGMNVGLGVGLASACISGAEITFGEETSWVHPVIREWEDLDKLVLSDDNRWLQLLLKMTQRTVDLCAGDYVPSSYCFFGPSDLANALRGNDLFYDYYDTPDQVHRLMDFCADATVWLHGKLRQIIGLVDGGTIAADMWLPGEGLYMSEDASDLCSAEIYKTFTFPYTQKVIDRIGGAYIHHHAKGWHIHKEIARLKHLTALEISWDPNCPRPIDHILEIYQVHHGLPLQTRCTAQDVYDHIDELLKCRIILMVNVDSLDDAHRVMDFIRRKTR